MKSRPLPERLAENWPAKVLSVVAALVLFLFNRFSNLEERFLSVPLQVVTASGYIPAAPYPKVVRVTIRGEAGTIFPILEDDIEAVTDLTEYTSEGVYRVPVIIRRQDTALEADALEFRVDPLNVTITLEQLLVKSVDVTPTLSGFPARGYEMTQSFVSPPAVTVAGPRSLMESLQAIPTEDVELAGKQESFTTRVRLAMPSPLLSVRGGEFVEFRATIQEAVILRTLEPVDVVTIGLDPELSVRSTLPSGSIRVQTSQNQLENLKPDQVQLLVDCSGIESPGVYTLPARPDLPRGFLVLSFEPTVVRLEIGRTGGSDSIERGEAQR